MIVSIILNISELSASHLSHVTAVFVVDGYQFGPSWIFGPKKKLMACANLVCGTILSKAVFFLTLQVSINGIKYSQISASHLSRATAIFVVGCCQFGPSRIFG